MKSKLFWIFIFSLMASEAFSQKNFEEGTDPSFWERVYFGGNMGLQLGDYTAISLSPIAGYMFTNRFSAGLGVTYQYLNIKDIDYSTNTYGGRVFGRYNITETIFLHSEYESINYEYPIVNTQTGEITSIRNWIPGLFIGGGFFQPIGRSAGFNITALYNLLYDDLKSPYNSPFVVRVGFTL